MAAPPAATATPAPPVSVPVGPDPAAAILDDAAAGLPRTGGEDRLSAEEYARDEADEPAALAAVAGWGWDRGARRRWESAPRAVEVTLLRALRPEGAANAFGWMRARAAAAEGGATPCPAGPAALLDECAHGATGGTEVYAGRRGDMAFLLVTWALPPAETARLAVVQAARLT